MVTQRETEEERLLRLFQGLAVPDKRREELLAQARLHDKAAGRPRSRTALAGLPLPQAPAEAEEPAPREPVTLRGVAGQAAGIARRALTSVLPVTAVADPNLRRAVGGALQTADAFTETLGTLFPKRLATPEQAERTRRSEEVLSRTGRVSPVTQVQELSDIFRERPFVQQLGAGLVTDPLAAVGIGTGIARGLGKAVPAAARRLAPAAERVAGAARRVLPGRAAAPVADLTPTVGRELGRGTYFSTSRDIAQGFAEGRAPFAGAVSPRVRTGTEVVSEFSIPQNTKIFTRDNALAPALWRQLQELPEFARVWAQNWSSAAQSRNNVWAAAEEAGILPRLQALLESQGFKGARHTQGAGLFDYAVWDASIIGRKGGGIQLFRGARAAAPAAAAQAAVPLLPPRAAFPRPAVEAARSVTPTPAVPELAANVIGLRPIRAGLTRTQEILNNVRRTLGKPFNAIEDSPFAQAALGERGRVRPIINSQAARLGTKGEELVRATFVQDARGRILDLAGVDPTVPGAPAIQDIAARLPRYLARLTQEQKAALATLRAEVAPYRRLFVDNVGDIGSRTDVIEGGFYLPRGPAALEGADEPIKVLGRRATGTRQGFRQAAKFASQAEGLEKGFVYSSLGESLTGYARGVGSLATDAHVAQFLKTAREGGELIGQPLKGPVPRQQGIIGFPGLEATTFPDEIANAANKILRQEGPPTGFGAIPTQIGRAYNNLYRSLRSTLDNSALGIQGLLGLANDQKAYGAALKVNLRAWAPGGDRALGRFIIQFDEKATQTGRLPSEAWGRAGLHLGGGVTEFTQGLGRIGQLPGIRQANRAFGFFGDALRLEWADHELAKALRAGGMSVEEAVAQGVPQRIASALNGTTGTATRRVGGDLGEMATFAPRFLMSRLETATRAALSVRPGATLEQRIARRAILKLVGYGTLLTVAANELQGRDTDFRPIVNGRYNPNFMRTRIAGRDVTFFGTWDSLARLIITTASGRPTEALRGLSSGIVNQAWNILSGEEIFGERVRDNPAQFGRYLVGSHTPFATDEVPQAIGQIKGGIEDGDPLEIVGGVFTISGESVGLKSSPLSFQDIADEVALGLGFARPYAELEPFKRDEVERDPRLLEYRETHPSSGYYARIDELAGTRSAQMNEIAENRVTRRTTNQMVDEYFSINTEFAVRRNEAAFAEFGVSDFSAVGDESDPERRALAEYYQAAEAAKTGTGIFVASVWNRIVGGLTKKWKAEGTLEYVQANTNLRPVPPRLLRILPLSVRTRIRLSQDARKKRIEEPVEVAR